MNQQPQPAPTPAPIKIWSVADVADFLKIPVGSIYEKTRARSDGRAPLPCRRVGKYLRFFEHEVVQWLAGLPTDRPRRRRRKAGAA